ncbi:CCAMK, partial [Symbiodinium microadriaticum]
ASEMKLIDFGFMVSLPPSGVLTQPGKLFGTEGWYAPESILHFEYSTKTDIWQAGCILYTMLAGHPPFHSNAKYRYQITRLSYSAMQGPAWDGISDEAKDLVDRMLNKDPQARISIEEILQHPWLSGIASTQNFGEEYVQRIRDLALRQKLKKVFTAHQVEDEHRYLRSSFPEVLPFLRPATESDTSITDDFISCSEFSARIMQLKEILVSAIYEQSQPQNDLDHEGRQVGNSKRRRLQHHGQIDFEVFCNLVCQAGLAVLAKPEVFQVFDTNGDGSVDMKEFL